MKLKKLPYKKIEYAGVQCPIHMPQYATISHEECLKTWKRKATKEYKESYEYKITEALNGFIDAFNSGQFQCSCKPKARIEYREYNNSY